MEPAALKDQKKQLFWKTVHKPRSSSAGKKQQHVAFEFCQAHPCERQQAKSSELDKQLNNKKGQWQKYSIHCPLPK